MKILIIRNDKLGDFVLSLPVFHLIKQKIPGITLHAFVPQYTCEIAEHDPYIDKVIIDPGSSAGIIKQLNVLNIIRHEKYDAIITLYSTFRVGLLGYFSGTPYRLAPATKISQVFYNHRLTQRRSRSLKPEYEYNLDLAKQFLTDFNYETKYNFSLPFIKFPDDDIKDIRKNFANEYGISADKKLIFIHPGTGGSATNLDLAQYAELAKKLAINNQYCFVITAGPSETEFANKLASLLGDLPHIVYSSTKGLLHFAKVIQLCDLFISGSTGPLHIAGALNRPTAAFYQRRRSATPLRWQTLNAEDKRLAFTPPEEEDESDMKNVDLQSAAAAINTRFIKN